MNRTPALVGPFAQAIPLRLATRARVLLANEPVVIGVGALIFAVLAVAMAVGATPVYLTPDGGHAITDARALIGTAPRTFYYLPGWPAVLVPLLSLGVAPISTVAIGLAVLCGLLFASLAALVRPMTSFRGSLVAATVGAASTPVGELLGWQGGSTLLGLVAIVAALAAFERWETGQRWASGILVGALFALALASHPFMAVVGAGLLGLRWLATARPTRIKRSGWGPASIPGLIVAGIVPLGAMVLLLPRYLAIHAPANSTIRPADLSTTFHLFAWITRESPALALLLIGATVAALLGPATARAIGGGVAALFVAFPAVLAGDVSYQSRVAYLLPILLAIGAALAWQWVGDRLLTLPSSRPRRSHVTTLLSPLAVALLVASIGFPGRLSASVPFYSPLSRSDATLIASLAGSPGTVATSWQGNQYFGGLSASWLVEGLANRPAIGPADPVLSTRPVEIAQAAEAWRLFSGESGIENGALQVSVGPTGWRADPAIAGAIQGYFVPLVYLSDASNDYGTGGPVGGTGGQLRWTVAQGAISGRRPGVGKPSVRTLAVLDGDHVILSWIRSPADSGEPWTIWLWPAYGLPWRDVEATGSAISFAPIGDFVSRDLAGWNRTDPRVTVAVTGDARLTYVGSEPRYRVQAVEVAVPAGSDLNLSITVTGTSQPGPIRTYDERSIIANQDIRSAAVWLDTGWADRFATSPCWQKAGSSALMATFDVAPGCLAGGATSPSRAP